MLQIGRSWKNDQTGKDIFPNTSYVSAVFRKVYSKHKMQATQFSFVSEYYNFYIRLDIHYVLFYYCVQFYAWHEKLTLSQLDS